MKRHWPRQQPLLSLEAAGAAVLLRPLYPDARVIELTPLEGGLTNTNLRVRLAGRDAPLLLRLYQRAPAEAEKEAAIAQLLERRAPVARFLHVAGDNPVTGHPYAVVEWIEGQCLATLLPGLDDASLAQLGGAIGRALGAIHGVTFERYGFFADGLSLPEAIDLDSKGILAYLRASLTQGPGRDRLGEDLTSALLAYMAREAAAIDGWLPPPCLVHGDFNPANLLVGRDEPSGQWTLAAVLDWEFAFSGTPPFDFGNLLRPPLGRHGGLVDALAAGYRAAGGRLPDHWQHIASLVDLTAWTEMLSRPTCAAEVVVDARHIVQATMIDDMR